MNKKLLLVGIVAMTCALVGCNKNASADQNTDVNTDSVLQENIQPANDEVSIADTNTANDSTASNDDSAVIDSDETLTDEPSSDEQLVSDDDENIASDDQEQDQDEAVVVESEDQNQQMMGDEDQENEENNEPVHRLTDLKPITADENAESESDFHSALDE